jgi:5-methylcytosine-specific restriction endonuclease McrA
MSKKRKRVKRTRRNKAQIKRVKDFLFERYGFICTICEKKFNKKQLELHHVIKHEHSHSTTIEDSGLTCTDCHHNLHQQELYNKKEYHRLNNRIREYKASH